MLCIVIKGPSYEEVRRQIAQVIPYADVVELRLELFSFLDSQRQSKKIGSILQHSFAKLSSLKRSVEKISFEDQKILW